MSWYKKSQTFQNSDPHSPNFMVDIGSTKRKTIDVRTKTSINTMLYDLGNFFPEIPLEMIFDILHFHNVWPIQEDGTLWSGFVTVQGDCGSEKANRQGPMHFDLAVWGGDNYVPANNSLIMTACTMPSGSIEVVVYVS